MSIINSSYTVFDCVVIGDIFIDINVRFSTNEIIRGGVTECEEFICTPGGISNIAVVLSQFNCKVAIVGKCGKDIFGDFFIKDIVNHNIIPYIVRDNLPTGLLISLVDTSAERSFIIARGANNTLTIDEVDKIFSSLQYRYLYAAGYSLVHSPQRDAIIHAMERAKQLSVITIFDPGSYNIIRDKNYEYFMKALRLTNILSCNLEEAKALSHTYELKDAISYLAKIVPIVIIRLGEKGCIVCNGQDTRFIQSQLQVKARDTTGAGDAFTSSLIYGLIKGLDIYKSAYFANLFAAMKVTKMGSRYLPSKRIMRRLLQRINNFNLEEG
ncbi:MAG: carbohydrate kinase family protein [Candidatus Nitrosocaldaceae archaeon]